MTSEKTTQEDRDRWRKNAYMGLHGDVVLRILDHLESMLKNPEEEDPTE